MKIPEGDNSGWSGSNAVPPSGSATDAFGVHKFKEVIRDKPELGRFPVTIQRRISDVVWRLRVFFPDDGHRVILLIKKAGYGTPEGANKLYNEMVSWLGGL